MNQRLSRKEIKRDRIGEVLSRTMAYLSENLKLVGMVLGGLAVILIVGLALEGAIGGRQDVASDRLADAIETLNAPLSAGLPTAGGSDATAYGTAEERRMAALGQFETVVEKYGRSRSARVARSYIAVLAHEGGDGSRARELWEDLAGGDDVLSAQAQLNLFTLDRQEGRAAEYREQRSGGEDFCFLEVRGEH